MLSACDVREEVVEELLHFLPVSASHHVKRMKAHRVVS